MEISKEIERYFLKDYFFFKGKIEIDSKYFIEKIKEGCSKDTNLNFKTNIKGLMTGFHYFDKDPKFLKILQQFICYIDDKIDFAKYTLIDSWGMEVRHNEKTEFHTHSEALWSGVVYLNSSNQELIFPEIDCKVKPEEGVFALFSPFLKHGCHRNTDKHSKFGISFNMQAVKDW